MKEDPTAFETLANGFIRRTAAKTQYAYDLVGRMTVSTDANGNDTRLHFEGGGEANRTEWLPAAGSGTADDPDVEAKRIQHTDVFGDVRQIVDELRHTTEQKFDRNHNLVEVKKLSVTRKENFVDGEFDGLFRDYFKGANGVAPVGESLTTTYSYDALGQRIKRTDALGQTELTWYDGLGRVTKVSSAAGRSTLYGYDLISASDQSAKKVLGVGGASVGGQYKTTTQADGGVLKEAVDYFGHTTSHVDLGGNTFTYNYDFAGQLQSQSSVRAKAGATNQKIEYTYLQNGMLAEIRDLAAGQATLTRYGYDDAGNRTYEEYARLDTSIDSKGKVAEILQASSIVYDERNRIVRVADGIDASGAAIANTNNSTLTRSHDLRYEYDAVGNRRAAYCRYWNPLADGGAGKLTDSSNYYYTYDRANRFVITKGNLVRRGSSATDTTTSIVLGLEGTRLSYDASGQRTKALHTDGSLEVYTYSSDGFLEDTLIQLPTDAKPLLSARRRVDAIGRTRDYVEYEASATSPGGRAIRQRRTTAYDAENRVLVESVYGGSFADHTNFVKGNIYSYFDGIAQTTSSTSGAGALASVFEYWTAETTLYSYELWDTAKQSKIDRRGDSIGFGWTSFVYDANGHLSSSSDEVGSVDVTYLTNAEGLVMRCQDVSRTDPSKSYLHQYYYATGRRVGDVGTNPEDKFRVSYVEQLAQSLPSTADTGYHADRFENFAPITSADFDQSYEPINSDYPAATGVSYIARTGDTLRAIAQMFWGDSSLWYLLAEANGFHDDTRLVQGQVVVIPNKVTNFHNNASTFRPYNPGEVIGRIQPTLNDYQPFEYAQTFWQADEEFFAASGMLDVLGMRDSFFGIGPKSISSWSTASSLNRDNTLWGAMERSGLPGSDVLGRLLLGNLDWRGIGAASFSGTASSPTPLSFSDDAAARRRARESYGLEDLVVGNAIGESLASGDNYNRWGTDDTETQRLLARYPAAASGNGSTFDWEAAYASQDREMDGERRPWRPREGNGDNSRLELSDYRNASGIDSPTMDTREPNGRLQAAEATMAAILETRQQIAYQQAKDAGRLRTLADSPIEPVQGITAVDLSLSSAGASLQDIQPLPALSFQEVNDQRVLAGTYDRNQQIGQAWSDGRYGDVWRHLNFEASDAGKAAVNARLFPHVIASSDTERLNKLVSSPIGATASLFTRFIGGSQKAQDVALDIGAFGEASVGAALGLPRTVGPTQSRAASPAWRRDPLPPKVFDPNGNQIPYGFKTYGDYASFVATMRGGLPAGTTVVFKGSAVTGRSSRYSATPGRPFDVGRTSDFDIALVGDDLYLNALHAGRAAGFKVKTMPERMGPLSDAQADLLGLRQLQRTLSKQAGRPVEFMLYDNVQGAMQGPAYLVNIGVGL